MNVKFHPERTVARAYPAITLPSRPARSLRHSREAKPAQTRPQALQRPPARPRHHPAGLPGTKISGPSRLKAVTRRTAWLSAGKSTWNRPTDYHSRSGCATASLLALRRALPQQGQAASPTPPFTRVL
jgi:hypothetical protein